MTNNATGTNRCASGIAGVVTYISVEIKNCYNVGNINSSNEDRRACILGYSVCEPENCYWLNGTAKKGIGRCVDISDTTIAKTSEEMKKIATDLGEDFKDDTNNINNGYPILTWQ